MTILDKSENEIEFESIINFEPVIQTSVRDAEKICCSAKYSDWDDEIYISIEGNYKSKFMRRLQNSGHNMKVFKIKISIEES